MTQAQAEELSTLYKQELPGVLHAYTENNESFVAIISPGDKLSKEEYLDAQIKVSIPSKDYPTLFYVHTQYVRLCTKNFEEAKLFVPIIKHYTV